MRAVGEKNVQIFEIEVCSWAHRLKRELFWISELHTDIAEDGCNFIVKGRPSSRLIR
jgi:thioredoxin-related protein